ncbi:hydrolase [Microaceticoccus formicicus]|uniref:hydrolase n=1 Tax=Microaceticoccus formicicus TaxID=3118105 RepID=UPI003CD00DE0|nr:hydrolase [Peptoniphilaceae bacterium AMB_02]
MTNNEHRSIDDVVVNIDSIEEKDIKTEKFIPEIKSNLRNKIIKVPEAVYKASGIKVLGVRIKSLLFTTDVALLKNHNAHSIIAVYPFTPQLSIMQAIITTASVPVFTGVGGGLTTGVRAVTLALQAELMGAYGVVVNAPMQNNVIKDITKNIDIPLIATVVSFEDDFKGKIHAGASILNVSGGKNTVELVKMIRKSVGDEFPIIATGGNTEDLITATIDAGANAITYTPPTSAEMFAEIMIRYRENIGDYR